MVMTSRRSHEMQLWHFRTAYEALLYCPCTYICVYKYIPIPFDGRYTWRSLGCIDVKINLCGLFVFSVAQFVIGYTLRHPTSD